MTTPEKERFYPWDSEEPLPAESVEDKQRALRSDIERSIHLPEHREGESHADHLKAVARVTQFRRSLFRVATNPTLSREEENLGLFKEMLEPQVAEAVMELRAKGYQTGGGAKGSGSGFFGTSSEQFVDLGSCQLPAETISALQQQGVSVTREEDETRLSFTMTDDDTLGTLTTRWQAIAARLPNRGSRVPPAWKRAACLETGYGEFIKESRIHDVRSRKKALLGWIEDEAEVEIYVPYYPRGKAGAQLRKIILDYA